MSLFETGFAVDAHQPASAGMNGSDARKRKRPSDDRKAAQTAEASVNLEKLIKQLEEANEGEQGRKKQKQKQQKKRKTENKEDDHPRGQQSSASPPKKGKQDGKTQGDMKEAPAKEGKQKHDAKKASAAKQEDNVNASSSKTAGAATKEPTSLTKKEKKKLKAEAAKAAYVPSEADLAKRQERQKKKEAKEKAAAAAAEAPYGSTHHTTVGSHDDDAMDVDAHAAASEAGPNPSGPSQQNQPSPAMTQLQKSMQKKLGGARFRWINEQLVSNGLEIVSPHSTHPSGRSAHLSADLTQYTTTGERAYELMREDPSMFDEYHSGFRSQAASWPSQPINLFVDSFNRDSPASTASGTGKPVIADLGCGDAQLAKSLVPKGFTVLSYDLISKNDWVVEAQCSKHVPLPGSNSDDAQGSGGSVVDAVVCCLSLMGHDWINMVKEARRITKMG